jgi:SNF2 family DNA or RNA helicase
VAADIELIDEVIELRVPQSRVEQAKTIPGARWDGKRRIFTLPVSWATCVVSRGVFGADLQVGPRLAAWAAMELDHTIRPALSVRDEKGPDQLYGYQVPGSRFLSTAGSALMADEMGTGKTKQTIDSLMERQSFPALIVCPNGVKSTWAREWTKWAPDVEIRVAGNGTATATKAAEDVLNGEAQVLVINWEALKNLSRLTHYSSIRLQTCSNCDPSSTRRPSTCEREPKILNEIEWSTVVADEVHRALDPRAKQTRALWAVGDKAGRRIGLTGTPVANDPSDIWSIMRFVAPNEYPSRVKWVERYALLQPNPFSGFPEVVGFKPDLRAELDRYFLPRFIRRTKDQVLKDLPPKVYERVDVFLTGQQKKAYDALEKNMIAQLDGGVIATTNTLTAALRLRQLASAYGEMVPDPRDAVTELTLDDADRVLEEVDLGMRLSEPSSKLDELERVLESLGGKQVVIFAESKQLIDMTFARLADRFDCSLVAGPVNTGERASGIENFVRGLSQIMLATIAAGGEGIDGMQVADTAIYLQRPWSLILNKQSEDRLHRIGQEGDCVTYIDLVAKDTVEDRVFDALMKKDELFEKVVRDREALRSWLR